MCQSFFGLDAFLDIHVKGSVKQIGKVVELSDSGTALRNAPGSVVDSSFDIAIDFLLLFDLAYRELRHVSVCS